MACRLHGAKPLPEPVLTYCQLDHWERLPIKLESKNKIFFHVYVFEAVVCEMAAMLYIIFIRNQYTYYGTSDTGTIVV